MELLAENHTVLNEERTALAPLDSSSVFDSS